MKTRIYGTFIIILLLSLLSCQVAVKEKEPIPAPDFSVADINGNPVSLNDFRGKVIILDFWATWCIPCRQELPHFQELHEAYKDRGFAMVGVSVDQGGTAMVKPFVEKNRLTYVNLIATEEMAKLYGEGTPAIKKMYGPIQGIPATFIINKKGEIVQKYVGEVPRRIFEAHIKKLLEEPAS